MNNRNIWITNFSLSYIEMYSNGIQIPDHLVIGQLSTIWMPDYSGIQISIEQQFLKFFLINTSRACVSLSLWLSSSLVIMIPYSSTQDNQATLEGTKRQGQNVICLEIQTKLFTSYSSSKCQSYRTEDETS